MPRRTNELPNLRPEISPANICQPFWNSLGFGGGHPLPPTNMVGKGLARLRKTFENRAIFQENHDYGRKVN